MKSAVSRVVVALSVVAALGATAACGGSGDDGDGGGGGKDSAKPGVGVGAGAGASKGGADAAARLEKAALATGDVKGYKVEKPKAPDASAPAAPAAGKTSPAVCAPLTALLAPDASQKPQPKPKPKPKPKAHVGRILTNPADNAHTTTHVELSAYTQADAKRLMADLRTATKSKKCAAFRVDGLRYLDVKALPAPDKGDEAVTYKLVHRKGEYTARERVTVVRDGSTLMTFDASNLYDPAGVQDDREAEREGMQGIGTPRADEDPKVDTVIVDAQLGKF
ncbi:hypothetical protein GKQ77_05500 [Streptomyces sp. BG9H]|uniref:Lipoprotein n=1 Tax=Streptomyces anatolicus TaxID=2675858 RepID=A0ABS6YHZ5_9ACTN|nr:hypothetical protein [Streptomyces anatolicus]MBW5421022.1 hypothetical protein [Streptomyces anatolicus]